VKDPLIRKTVQSSKLKTAHLVHITHRDQVEPPLTSWLQEAFNVTQTVGSPAEKRKSKPAARKKSTRA
jgi:hypothetical protein